jgi:hypothetical protein
MANVIRSAKSSSKWNDNDLIAYNITITAVPSHHFFPQGTNVPLTTTGLDPALATADADVRVDADVSDSTYRFLRCLYETTKPIHGVAVRLPGSMSSLVWFSPQLASMSVCIAC